MAMFASSVPVKAFEDDRKSSFHHNADYSP
jgi:hypothetical protein